MAENLSVPVAEAAAGAAGPATTPGTAVKVAFIGTHGVGKTTLCYGLAAQLKAADVALDVVGEIARRSPLPINRRTTAAAQQWILHTQIAEELVASSRAELVICDRSVLDNFVYLRLSSGPHAELDRLVSWWTSTYDLLVHVPIVGGLRADGLRSTDPTFQRAVDEELRREITTRRLDVLDLRGVEREEWLERASAAARRRLGPTQLELMPGGGR
ncbi:MAG: ATP-binding protein [Acidobacteriota bacterium]